jgi:ATP phosphoribosyltransferase
VQGYHVLTANILGNSHEGVAQHLLAHGETAGMQGPTIARVFPKEKNTDGLDWYAVTVVVESALLLRAVDHLRQSGASGITVVRPDYVFGAQSDAYARLLAELGIAGAEPIPEKVGV